MVRFSDLILGPQDNGFIQKRGVVAGTRVGVVIVIPVFLAALVAVFLVVLVFFGRYLGCSSVPGQGILAWSFGFLFLLLFWLALSLISWLLFWSLLLCSWGPGTRTGSCMAVSVPLSYDFGCYFLHLMKHRYCQTILTFQHVISSLRVYAFAILNKVRSRYVKDPDCLAA